MSPSRLFAEAGDDLARYGLGDVPLGSYIACAETRRRGRNAGERALECARRAGSRLDEIALSAGAPWVVAGRRADAGRARRIRISSGRLRELANDPTREATIAASSSPISRPCKDVSKRPGRCSARSRAEGGSRSGLFRTVSSFFGAGLWRRGPVASQAADAVTMRAAAASCVPTVGRTIPLVRSIAESTSYERFTSRAATPRPWSSARRLETAPLPDLDIREVAGERPGG